MTSRLLLPTLLLGSLAPLHAASGASPSTQEIQVPGLTRYTIQDLLAPPVRLGEPAAMVVDVDGEPYVLDLQPHSLRADGMQLIEVHDGVRIEHALPPVSTYRGLVYGRNGERIEDARVLGSEGPQGWSLAIDLPGRERVLVQPVSELAPEAQAPAGLHVVFDTSAVALDGSYRCGTDVAELPFQIHEDDPPVAQAVTGNRIAEIAIDTDVEFTNLYSQVVVDVQRDIERVMNLVEDAYERDTQITYEITSIVVRTGALGSDPYNTTNPGSLLNQLDNHWSGNFQSVRRDVVHLMTGKNLDGSTIGIATLSSVCRTTSYFGLSQSRFTTNFNSRAALTAHELGHNWSAGHCDGNGDCHIMCSGLGGCNGLGNPARFGTPSANGIISYRNSAACLVNEPNYIDPPFFEGWPSTGVGQGKWVFNDGAVPIDGGSNEPTADYALQLNSEGTTEGQQDDIRTHFIDTSAAADLSVSFFTQHIGVEAGESLIVEFRNLANRFWSNLTTITSDGVDQTEFEFHKFDLQDNMYHDRFRIRFRVDTDQVNDWWLVDNVLVHDGPNMTQDKLVRGQLFDTAAYGVNPGQTVIFYASLTGGAPLGTGTGVSFLGGAVVLDIDAPLINLGLVQADANGVATRTLFMPFSVAPGTQVWTQAIRLEPILANSKTSNPVTEIVQ